MDHAHSPKLLVHCPLCQASYEDTEVRLLGEKGTTRLFHCTCRACGHAMLALILESNGSVSSVGLVTDLEVQDALRFQNLESLTADECIFAHSMFYEESKAFCGAIMKA